MSTFSSVNNLFGRGSRLLGGALIFIGAVWGLLQMNFIPKYGDTQEYINLSQAIPLRVDQFRTILFPFILRTSFKITPHFFQIPLYLFQLLLFGGALRHLVKTTETYFGTPFRIKVMWMCLFFLPIVLHLNLTVLSDGIALSFFILFTSMLTRIVLFEQQAPIDFLLYFFYFVFAALSRSEKLYVTGGSALAAVFFATLVTKTSLNRVKKIAFTSFIGFVTVVAINSYTQVRTPEEAPPDFTFGFLYRALFPRFEKVYPFMPEAVRAKISLADARLYDSDPNAYRAVMYKLCGNDWECSRPYAKQMLSTVLRHESPALVFSIFRDMFYYTLAPWIWITSPWTSLGHFEWTYSRYAMNSPRLSWSYNFLGNLFILALTFSIALRILKSLRVRFVTQKVGTFTFFILCPAIANAGLFALMMGHPFHIRYALPTYFSWIFLLIVYLNLLDSPSKTYLEANNKCAMK